MVKYPVAPNLGNSVIIFTLSVTLSLWADLEFALLGVMSNLYFSLYIVKCVLHLMNEKN